MQFVDFALNRFHNVVACFTAVEVESRLQETFTFLEELIHWVSFFQETVDDKADVIYKVREEC